MEFRRDVPASTGVMVIFTAHLRKPVAVIHSGILKKQTVVLCGHIVRGVTGATFKILKSQVRSTPGSKVTGIVMFASGHVPGFVCASDKVRLAKQGCAIAAG